MIFVFGRFKYRRWKRYSSSKRLRVLQALENKLAKKNHREPIDVVVHERADWSNLGMFSVSNGKAKIYVHENLILDSSYRFHALETIIHEGRHATQFLAASKENIPWWNFRAKRWKRNFEGYVSASEDKLLYNNQEVERDAQKYTIKMLQKLEYKYNKEEDFQETLAKNIYRYENSEIQAKKKYGLFYKYKMRRKIDKRR